MNDNFLTFINEDIDTKRTLLSTLPTKTNTNKKKYNEQINLMIQKYDDYKNGIRNYMLAKSRSFALKKEEQDDSIEKIKEKIEALDNVRFLLNPFNTYFEKMGFDDLLYQINNYYVFNFNSLNDIINGFLDKFELIGIKLSSNDFDYTCYVHEYMSSFLEVRYKKAKDYEKVSEIFEQIYWINPEIVEHIELNFRKLIKDNEKKFDAYISKIQKNAMIKNNIKNYNDCLEKLQSLYIELNLKNKEDIYDIVSLAMTDKLDVEQLRDGNKVRNSSYESLVPETALDEAKSMNRMIKSLEKLQFNIEEYKNYLEVVPIISNFKNEYEKFITEEAKKSENKDLHDVKEQINSKENELEKINKKILSGKPGLFEFKNDSSLKQLKMESLQIAKQLYELYKKYDTEYFKDKVMNLLTKSMTVSDFLNLYYSFDYFKKITIRNVYKLDSYEEVLKYSDNFDMFAMDPTNLIIDGVFVFENNEIPKIIANKYRLSGVKITEDDLSEENLDVLLNKITLILRVNTIEKSDLTVDKLWFMQNVEKIVSKEQNNN